MASFFAGLGCGAGLCTAIIAAVRAVKNKNK